MHLDRDIRIISKIISSEMANPRKAGAVILVILGTIILLSIVLDSAPQRLSLCLFRTFTGLPCPSCGMTRAFISLGHGDIYSAVLFNPASILIYIATWVGFILALLQTVYGKKYIEIIWSKYRKALFPLILTIMTSVWIYQLVHHFNQ
jgi:hypothetical protein